MGGGIAVAAALQLLNVNTISLMMPTYVSVKGHNHNQYGK